MPNTLAGFSDPAAVGPASGPVERWVVRLGTLVLVVILGLLAAAVAHRLTRAGQPPLSFRQPPARLLAMIWRNIAIRARSLIGLVLAVGDRAARSGCRGRR